MDGKPLNQGWLLLAILPQEGEAWPSEAGTRVQAGSGWGPAMFPRSLPSFPPRLPSTNPVREGTVPHGPGKVVTEGFCLVWL